MKEYKSNIEKVTLKNKFYRDVLFTGKHMQLVVMSLNVGEDIPMEVHKNHDQFIRIESGKATVITNGRKHKLGDGDAVIIPAGTKHRVINNGKKKLKLYTIYSPPEHKPRTLHRTRADSIED